ncbi:MAG: M20 family metallopeptidase [Spirochaetales bacterium]|nr:M20 family metallopeptidase [Spirochaetales bacterium]
MATDSIPDSIRDPHERKLLEALDREEVVALTQKLVQIDSVIRPETGNTEAEVVAFIRDWLRKELGMDPAVEEVEPGRENIVATLDSGRPGPCLMLEGHTDVVSEGERSRWTMDPFGGEIKDGRLYGRGSCDMKAGVAVHLVTLKALLRSGVPYRGRVRLGLVCDEEGMMIGIKEFIRRGHADDVDAALVSEPEENQLCLSMKGALRAVVRVTGKMAHGAMPRTGINPNTRLARIILSFEEFEGQEIARCGEDEYLGFPSVTFTVVQSPPPGQPAQLNVMPGESQGFVDIRTTPCQSHPEIREALAGILKRLAEEDPEFKAEIEFIEDRPVVTMEAEEPIVQAAVSAYRDVTGREPVYNGVPGATDGTFLRAWKGVPSLVNGPGPRHMPHQADEYVELEELWEAAQINALAAYRFLNREAGGGGAGEAEGAGRSSR